MLRLKDKVALITGSGMGLGQAMALLFSREGAKIVVTDINTEAGEKTVDAIRKEERRRDFCPSGCLQRGRR